MSGAVTNGAGAGDGEEALLVTYLPAAGALFAGFRTAPGGRAGSPAISADFGAAKLDLLPVVSRANIHYLLGIVVLPDVLHAFGVEQRDSPEHKV